MIRMYDIIILYLAGMGIYIMNFDNDDRPRMNFTNLFQPLIMIVLVVICTVMLVININMYRKVESLSDTVETMQEEFDSLEESPSQETSELQSISEEEADIAEAASLENQASWDRQGDKSDGMKRIYLTFDDGPSSNTDKILDVLDSYGIKATFFVVGKSGYDEQYKRIVNEGHTLAMHSYSHKYSEIYESLDTYKADLLKLHDFLYELTGVSCNIVRFPGGSSNTISKVDMKELIAYLDEEGMIYFDWNVSSQDATKESKSAQIIADNVLNSLNKFNNSVVLFHDASSKDSTVEALPIIIEKILESDDSVFLPISEDTVLVQHVH
jgi:peptidoglycan/xylan/chitin deacetylase (PgdA/CDA1 family)